MRSTSLLATEVLLHRKAIIFEHALARRGDPFLAGLEARPTYYDDEVYFVLDEERPSRSGIERLIGKAFTAQGLTAFVVPKGAVQSDEGQIRGIGRLSRSIDAIVVAAFDGETFVIWQRDK